MFFKTEREKMKLKGILQNMSKEFENVDIIGVTDDSRKVKEGYAFVCLNGPDKDGHNFAKAADASGVDIQGAQRDDSGVTAVLSVLGTILLVMVVVVGGYLGYNHLRRYLRRSRIRRRRASRRRSR